MSAHLNSSSTAKKDKKHCYELELFEQNLEDLLANELNPAASTAPPQSSTTLPKLSEDLTELNDSSSLDVDGQLHEELGGELALDSLPDELLNSDLAEWNVIYSEPNSITNLGQFSSFSAAQAAQSSDAAAATNLSPQSGAGSAGGNRKKRFKTNTNTSLDSNQSALEAATTATIPTSHLAVNTKNLKRFYYKPFLVFKCQFCSRKMSSFDLEHWLQHDRERHDQIFNNNNRYV